MEKTKTLRGFTVIKFDDCYGAKCVMQKSSLATYDAIWLGVEDADPKVLHGDAKTLGINTDATCGWVLYPIPDQVLLNTRMHLTRKQVIELLPYLQSFVETGEI